MTINHPRSEQVALSHLLDNAYIEFKQSVHSAGARFVLWGSFKDAADLQKNYLSAKEKKQLSDARRNAKSLSENEVLLKAAVEAAAIEAEEYRSWARQHSAQPILREMLVSYCSAFEACLKNVALVFSLANIKVQSLERQVFVPSDQFRKTLSDVKDKWRASGDADRSRAECFFSKHIAGCNPDLKRFSFLPSDAHEWRTCHAAFLARNAIVHQLGRPSVQIVLADEVIHPGWEIDLSLKQLQAVKDAFHTILNPLDPFNLLLL